MGNCLCMDKSLIWCDQCREYVAHPEKGITCIHQTLPDGNYYPFLTQQYSPIGNFAGVRNTGGTTG